ncbi:MAG: hypothetical protein ACRDVZ_01005, partial [Jiangellaceae bacterium]
RRLDISDGLSTPEAALTGYAVGDVVLAEVSAVHPDSAELRIHPLLAVKVSRVDVTSNDLDDLRTLMTPGEVLNARVTSAGPAWSLTLLDLDDAEHPRVAVSILAGGPPWLTPPAVDELVPGWLDEPPVGLSKVSAHEPAPAPQPIEAEPENTPPAEELPAKQARPTPAIFDKRRASSPTDKLAVATSGATATMALTIDGLKAKLAAAERDLLSVREELHAGAAERRALVESRQDQERHIARLEHELQVQRSTLRKAKQSQPASQAPIPEFADPEQAFRYAVLTSWATRTPVGEQDARPLPAYSLGPDFLESVRQTPGISLEKVADVVVEVVTGRAHEIAGRDLHQLRESPAPTAPYVRRSADDATCWRAALQVNTPQARRLHYWIVPGGRVEVSRVALHDDFRP